MLSRRLRMRKEAIRNALPNAIDILSACMSAGLTFQAGILKLSQRMTDDLGQEFGLVLSRSRIGQPLNAGLVEMGERVGVEEVVRFASAVVQAEEFGTPVSTILEKQAEDLRRARKQRAQEKAQKAGIKMLFPMMGCVFPTLFIILLGPAALSAIKSMAGQ